MRVLLRMSADIDNQAVAARRARFWVVPLVAGCCFSLGYGITHRLMAMQSSVREIKPERFFPQSFPGTSLSNLRRTSGDRSPLQVDLALINAREAAESTPQLQVMPMFQGNGMPAHALQTSPVAPLAAPTTTEFEFDEPIPALELKPALESDPIDTFEGEPAGAGDEPLSPEQLFLVEIPFSEPVSSPLLDISPPFKPELTDDFFLPVVPQAPLPPTP